MIAYLTSLLGAYTPLGYESADGSYVYLEGISGVNFDWLFKALVFLVLLISVLKILGGLVCRSSRNL